MLSKVIMPIATILATIALFFVFRPQEATALFGFNLCYCVLLESLFFGWLGIARSKSDDTTPVLRAILGVWTGGYLIAGAGTMLIYSLILSETIELKYYIAAIIVLTILWLLVSALTADTDCNHHACETQLNSKRDDLRRISQNIARLNLQLRSTCEARGIAFPKSGNDTTPYDRLERNFKSLTASALRNESSIAQLSQIERRANELAQRIQNCEDPTSIIKETTDFVNEAVAEIQLIRNTNIG